MDVRLPGQRTLAALVLASLALLTLFASPGGTPEVSISDLKQMDGGASVQVVGVIVDAWSTDIGSESLVLTDLESDATVKVVCVSSEVGWRADFRIGDEARAIGELEVTGGRPTIWTSADRVTVLRSSRDVVTLRLLAGVWDLLIDDRFEIRGVVVPTSNGGYRLTDADKATSISMSVNQDDIARYENMAVVVDATLRLDSSMMSLVLEVHSITRAS
jgi:hypothetical protein